MTRRMWMLPSVAALCLWGLWGFLPKIALQTMPVHGMVFYEAMGNVIGALPLLAVLKFRLERDPRAVAMSALNTGSAIIALLAFYAALRDGPVSAVVTLTGLYPVIPIVLSAVFLKEKIGRRQWLAVGMALAAVALLAG